VISFGPGVTFIADKGMRHATGVARSRALEQGRRTRKLT